MRLLLVLYSVVVLPLAAQTNPELDRLFKDYYETTLRESPEAATMVGRTDYNANWTDWSLKGLAAQRSSRQEFLKRLEAFRNASLTPQQRLSFELLEHELRSDLEKIERFRSFNIVNHLTGPHLFVFSTLAMAPANTTKDFQDRIARMKAIPAMVDGMIESAQQARASGLIPPAVVVQRLILQLDAQQKPAADRKSTARSLQGNAIVNPGSRAAAFAKRSQFGLFAGIPAGLAEIS